MHRLVDANLKAYEARRMKALSARRQGAAKRHRIAEAIVR
jgi:hypothetical protein